MKLYKIQITQFNKPDVNSPFTDRRKYSVYVGDYNWILFNTEESALAFLRNMSKILSECFYAACEIHGKLYLKFKLVYSYLEQQTIKDIDKINQHNDKIQFRLHFRGYHFSGNSGKIEHVVTYINNLLDICKLLKTAINRRQYTNNFELKIHETAIKDLLNKLQENIKKPG